VIHFHIKKLFHKDFSKPKFFLKLAHGRLKNCKNYHKKFVTCNLLVFKYSGWSGGKTQVPGFAQFPLQQKGTFTVLDEFAKWSKKCVKKVLFAAPCS
jgi:hypothetical protein